MTKFSNNPQSVYNGMISGQRNMFLTSSVAIAMAGFSKTFKDKSVVIIIKLLSLIILFISMYIGLKSSYDFRYYLDNIEMDNLSYVPINSWYNWSYVSYIYCIMMLAIVILFYSYNII